MAFVNVEVELDEFSDEEILEEVRLRDLHDTSSKNCRLLYDIYVTHGKEEFYEAAKKLVENSTGRIMV
jgi:hypothetical protein